jgi:peptide/nickel transport system permease protein
VLLAHVWRLAVAPVGALGGLAFASLLGGSFVVEIVTAWPGLARLTYHALLARDLPLVAGCAVAVATVLSVGLLISDVIVAWADPRTREG